MCELYYLCKNIVIYIKAESCQHINMDYKVQTNKIIK